MTLPFTFATQPTGNVPASDLDSNYSAVSNMAPQFCTASGTNTIALTSAANQGTITAYTNSPGKFYIFQAAATSTGNTTINVDGVGALNVYLPGGAIQAGSGVFMNGFLYTVQFQQSLNAGAGGFMLIGAPFTYGTENTMNPIATSSASLVSHGLSRKPDYVFCFMECLANDQNFTTGDRNYQGFQYTGAGVATISLRANSSSTQISVGATLPTVEQAGGTGTGVITAANWKVVAVPVLLNGFSF